MIILKIFLLQNLDAALTTLKILGEVKFADCCTVNLAYLQVLVNINIPDHVLLLSLTFL